MRGFNARTRYGLMAALYLARHYDGDTPIKVARIAADTGVPRKFLIHILLDLKRRMLVNSTRGAAGGYWLLRPPDMVGVGEVLAAVEDDGGGSEPPPGEPTPYGDAVSSLQERLERARLQAMAGMSLTDLLQARLPA